VFILKSEVYTCCHYVGAEVTYYRVIRNLYVFIVQNNLVIKVLALVRDLEQEPIRGNTSLCLSHPTLDAGPGETLIGNPFEAYNWLCYTVGWVRFSLKDVEVLSGAGR